MIILGIGLGFMIDHTNGIDDAKKHERDWDNHGQIKAQKPQLDSGLDPGWIVMEIDRRGPEWKAELQAVPMKQRAGIWLCQWDLNPETRRVSADRKCSSGLGIGPETRLVSHVHGGKGRQEHGDAQSNSEGPFENSLHA
jgi:hypothetical protein